MTPEPFYKSSAFQKGFFVSLSVNGVGLMFACSVMALGFVGAGMSSGTTEQLRETWYAFVWTAFCCPAVLNTGLLAFIALEAARKKDGGVWLGWLVGLGIALIPLLILAVFSVLIGGL
jgi:hypothetical protein